MNWKRCDSWQIEECEKQTLDRVGGWEEKALAESKFIWVWIYELNIRKWIYSLLNNECAYFSIDASCIHQIILSHTLQTDE